MSRSLCACAILLAAWAWAAIAMQGCGILVSSDCAQKAVCDDEAGPTVDATGPRSHDTSFTSPETGADIAREEGSGSALEGAKDAAAPDVTTDVEVNSSDALATEAGVDAAIDVLSDAGTDVGNDALAQESGAEPGPRCLASDGSFYFCDAGEHCCVNAATRAAVCAASCDENASMYAVDCPGASGDGGCGSQTCCGSIVLSGGVVPNCNASRLNSACVDSCDAGLVAPGSTGCSGRYAIRFCTAAEDCAMDPNGNTSCCNFGNPPSPVSWCVAPLSTAMLSANSCL